MERVQKQFSYVSVSNLKLHVYHHLPPFALIHGSHKSRDVPLEHILTGRLREYVGWILPSLYPLKTHQLLFSTPASIMVAYVNVSAQLFHSGIIADGDRS